MIKLDFFIHTLHKDMPLESLQYVYIGSHAFAKVARNFFMGTWYLDDTLPNTAI